MTLSKLVDGLNDKHRSSSEVFQKFSTREQQ